MLSCLSCPLLTLHANTDHEKEGLSCNHLKCMNFWITKRKKTHHRIATHSFNADTDKMEYVFSYHQLKCSSRANLIRKPFEFFANFLHLIWSRLLIGWNPNGKLYSKKPHNNMTGFHTESKLYFASINFDLSTFGFGNYFRVITYYDAVLKPELKSLKCFW